MTGPKTTRLRTTGLEMTGSDDRTGDDRTRAKNGDMETTEAKGGAEGKVELKTDSREQGRETVKG